MWDAWDPRWLYVSLEDDDGVALVDRTLGVVLRTIPAGRLPAGIAVSRLRRELVVLHRIDARATLISLEGTTTPADQRTTPTEVILADEPANADATIPQGRPFAFESLAWAPNGTIAWLPHQLLASRQPIQFQSTVFPAVSLLDLSEMRAEVLNDPATAPEVFAGRKTLFGAMKVLDASGDVSIVSQPCAAAVHPKGLVAYAIACGSEDLITFDASSGTAIDLLRNLPGDHPVGITLDDTGQRAFVLADQSQSVSIVDLGDGTPLTHARVIGEPLRAVARDPVDPEMREGIKLFFRANSNKGALATTGNNWMSCAACHLDGFVSTNLVFFEALKAKDSALDAQIGHIGLKDLFSTAPTPNDPAFNPHDVLVAFVDQGGLAPDRSGAKRDGTIDVAAPSADARTMAARVARVIARDLPLGPSWILLGDKKPDANNDGPWCGTCHKEEYDAWKKSAHAHAGTDPMVRFGAAVEQKARGVQYSRLCVGCHDPVSARLGDETLTSGRGITCLGCHDATRLLRAGGNADVEYAAHDWTADHKAWGLKSLENLRKPEFCGGCHQQFVPAGGIVAIGTLEEYQRSSFATPPAGEEQTVCNDCHLPKSDVPVDGGGTRKVADHAMVGGNVYLAGESKDPSFADRVRANVKHAITLQATRTGASVSVDIFNRGAGHGFPTGVTDIREPWIELQAVDAQQKTVGRYGGPGADGLLPLNAERLGIDIAKPDGTLLLLHELSDATRFPFDRRVPAGGKVTIVMVPPVALPPGATELHAVLLYRNIRTTYLRAATGDPNATSPEVEVARAPVQ